MKWQETAEEKENTTPHTIPNAAKYLVDLRIDWLHHMWVHVLRCSRDACKRVHCISYIFIVPCEVWTVFAAPEELQIFTAFKN